MKKRISELIILFYFFIIILKNKFIYLFLAAMGLAASGLSLVAASGGHSSSRCAGLLTIAASLVVEHRLQMRRLSNCGPQD